MEAKPTSTLVIWSSSLAHCCTIVMPIIMDVIISSRTVSGAGYTHHPLQTRQLLKIVHPVGLKMWLIFVINTEKSVLLKWEKREQNYIMGRQWSLNSLVRVGYNYIVCYHVFPCRWSPLPYGNVVACRWGPEWEIRLCSNLGAGRLWVRQQWDLEGHFTVLAQLLTAI